MHIFQPSLAFAFYKRLLCLLNELLLGLIELSLSSIGLFWRPLEVAFDSPQQSMYPLYTSHQLLAPIV